MIYFDNASTTNKKPFCVKMAVKKAISKKYCANPGRSSHNLSLNAGNIVFETREKLKEFFNAKSAENVIFTSGCTESLNLAILGTLAIGGHVILTSNEHNSVARPIENLKNQGKITTTIVKADKSGKINPEDIEKVINDKTYLVVVNHTSNVTGATSDIAEIGKVCKKHNVLFLVDAAQSAGHKKIDMEKMNISMLAIAGHKGLLGIQGVGALIFDNKVKIQPIKLGGTGTYSEKLLPPTTYPEGLEAGTAPTPAIFSLNAGTAYLSKHFEKVNCKIEKLTRFLLNELYKRQKHNNKIKIFTQQNDCNGVVSFTVENLTTSEIVSVYNEKGICVRAGLHCAPLCHERLNTLSSGGTVRVSLSHNNHVWEIKKFLKIFDEITKKQG